MRPHSLHSLFLLLPFSSLAHDDDDHPFPRPLIIEYPQPSDEGGATFQASSSCGGPWSEEELEVRLRCDSWRVAGEANNLESWRTVPRECVGYVEAYMTGRGYQFDLDMVYREARAYAGAMSLAGDDRDAWVFDVDETLLSNLPYITPTITTDEGTGLIGIGVEALATSVPNFHQMGLSVAGLANAKLGNPRVSNFYHKVRGMERLGDADNGRARASNIYQKVDSLERRSSADNNRARVSNFYQKSDATEGLHKADNGRARVSNLYQKGISGKGIAIDNNTGSGTTLEKQKSIDMVDGANFFLEKDLRPGMKMRLDFSRCTPEAVFIPRSTASSIPFSSEKLPHILSYFSVQPNSVEAGIMRTELEDCEEVDSSVESKYCPTSMESMVDYATSALGTRSITAVSSEFAKLGAAKQEYLVLGSSAIQKLHGSSCVACHQQPYPFAVFYCHVTRATKAYVVPLVGMDEARVDAVAVCHTDTSAWNPSHLAFRVLKVRPGTLPICHFLPQDGLVWAPREEALPALFDN